MRSDPDAALRRLFRTVHAEDARPPEFERLTKRRPRRGGGRSRFWVAVAAVVILGVAIVPALETWRRHRILAFARELEAWRAPTDSLLDEPYRPTNPLVAMGRPSLLNATQDMVRWRKWE